MSLLKLYWYVPILFLIFGTSILLTIKLKGIQFRKIFKALKLMLKSNKDESGEISSFGALCVSLSATIGTGSIIGVAVAIKIGGPGTLFWMILFSIFTLSLKYAEGFLAIKYRKLENKEVFGGPFIYIEYGMGSKYKYLSKLYALFGMLAASLGIGTMTQSNGITDAFKNAFVNNNNYGLNLKISIIIGTFIVIISALVIFGGTKRITRLCEFFIPLVTSIYILTILLIIINNISLLIPSLSAIIQSAFSIKCFAVSASNYLFIAMLVQGAQKGVFINEAGLGSSAIALACSKENDPTTQGLISMGSMLLTTLISILTGIVIVITSSYTKDLSGINITNDAFITGLFFNKTISSLLLFVCVLFFAVTTIIGWSLYGGKCLNYLFNNNKKLEKIYLIIYIIMVFLGAIIKVDFIWNMADICNALMAIPNLIALIYLSDIVSKETN